MTIILCPICSATRINTKDKEKNIVYLQTEEERMFHFLGEHEPYELAYAYNDLLSICERKHMMKTREISR